LLSDQKSLHAFILIPYSSFKFCLMIIGWFIKIENTLSLTIDVKFVNGKGDVFKKTVNRKANFLPLFVILL